MRILRESVRNGGIVCPFCKLRLNGKTSLVHHVQEAHDIDPEIAQGLFANIKTGNDQTVVNVDEDQTGNGKDNKDKKHQCTLCRFKSDMLLTMKRHVVAVHGSAKVNLFRCHYCDLNFKCSYLLTHHIKNKHPAVVQVSPFYQCSICHQKQSGTGSESRFLLHAIEKHFGTLFPQFTEKDQILNPWKEDLKKSNDCEKRDKPYRCAICSLRSASSFDLMRDVLRLHTKAKLFQCRSCSCKFRSESRLDIHVRNYHKKPPRPFFYCALCSSNPRYSGTAKELVIHAMKKHFVRIFPDTPTSSQQQIIAMFEKEHHGSDIDSNHKKIVNQSDSRNANNLSLSPIKKEGYIRMPQTDYDLDAIPDDFEQSPFATANNCIYCHKIFSKDCDLDLHIILWHNVDIKM